MSVAVPLHDVDVAPLWPHQQEAIDRALKHQGFMLAIGMGGGKSRCAIEIADQTLAQRVLVLCPKSVAAVWPDQVFQHSYRTWQVWAGEARGLRGPLRNPPIARRAIALIDAGKQAKIMGRPLCAVVNFEAAPAGDMGRLLEAVKWDLVILDESHRIKDPKGKQSRFVGRLCKRVRAQGGRVLALTGTPMPHSPLDLWAQFRAIDETVLGESYYSFRARYGAPKVKYRHADGTPEYFRAPGGHVIYEGVREDREAELALRVAGRMHQVPADELDGKLGLEEPVDTYRTCDLGAQARRVYDELERDLISRVGEGTVTAANAMVNVLRLAQVTQGFAVDADSEEYIEVGTEKAELLAELIEDIPSDEPIVVFGRFHRDLDRIEQVTQALGRRYGELSGRRRDGLDGPRMSAGVDVLGAQLKSGGVGIDLTRARYCVFYSLDFALADHLQARKRLHRPGQAHRVTYVYLLANNTIDRAIHGALRRREDVINSVLARMRGAAS